MYTKTKTDLLKQYKPVLINNAMRVWKSRGLSIDVIADKINELEARLQRATSKEFIAIFTYYGSRK